MGARLDPTRPVEEQIRLASRDELAGASAALRSAADGIDPGEGIHTARKSLRRFRATLRLLRPSIGRHAYRRSAEPARELGRHLSAPRDADVTARTVRSLLDDAGASPDGADGIARELDARWRAEVAALGTDDWLASVAPGIVVSLDEGMGSWSLDDLTWRALLDGVARSYRRASAAFEVAERDGGAATLHEVRKRTKDLRSQLELLRDLWEPMMTGQAAGARALSEAIGTLRDHDLVRSVLTAGDLDREVVAVLVAAIDDLDAQLRDRVRRTGSLLFAERPGAVQRRLRAYEPWTGVAAR